VQSSSGAPTQPRWWRCVTNGGRAGRGGGEERFDEELRYLLDEREHSDPPAPIVEYQHDEEPTDPERLGVEAGTRA
jgi:hypothetical protein